MIQSIEQSAREINEQVNEHSTGIPTINVVLRETQRDKPCSFKYEYNSFGLLSEVEHHEKKSFV